MVPQTSTNGFRQAPSGITEPLFLSKQKRLPLKGNYTEKILIFKVIKGRRECKEKLLHKREAISTKLLFFRTEKLP